ncbi:serine hydrolase domain-containing protein [Maridesulfovibrio sp.]|uniref:serine hydrolase domain-containing protein n=1 Tax=Maridesulfovibrio sp. TaxID=2795000 RepID=UPI003BAD50A7
MKFPLKLKLAAWLISNQFKKKKNEFVPNADHNKAINDFASATNNPAITTTHQQKDGKVHFSFAGHKNHKDKSNPDRKTVFRWYSITKTFTAIGIMQLREKNLLSLNDSISKYLDFPNGDKIEIKHLLNHTSGLPQEGPELFSWSHSSKKNYIGTQSFLKQQLHSFKKIKHQPGTHYGYSNFGYHLLGAIIEKVSGQKYDEYIVASIIEPLGLKNTFFYRPKEQINFAEGQVESSSLYKLLTEHFYPSALEQAIPPTSISYFSPFEFYPNTLAASGLFGTIEDLYIFGKALLDGFLGQENGLLKTDSFSQMIAGTTAMTGSSQKWELRSGMGLKIGKSNGKTFIMTDGSAPGFSSALRIYTKDKDIAAVVTNRSPMPIYQILDAIG